MSDWPPLDADLPVDVQENQRSATGATTSGIAADSVTTGPARPAYEHDALHNAANQAIRDLRDRVILSGWRGPYRFDHDTPGLAAGVELFTPAAGDLIVEVMISMVTAFSGGTTNPAFQLFMEPENLTATFNDPDAGLPLATASADEGTSVRRADPDAAPELSLSNREGSRWRPLIVRNAVPLTARICDADALPAVAPIDQTSGAIDVYVCIARPHAT